MFIVLVGSYCLFILFFSWSILAPRLCFSLPFTHTLSHTHTHTHTKPCCFFSSFIYGRVAFFSMSMIPFVFFWISSLSSLSPSLLCCSFWWTFLSCLTPHARTLLHSPFFFLSLLFPFPFVFVLFGLLLPSILHLSFLKKTKRSLSSTVTARCFWKSKIYIYIYIYAFVNEQWKLVNSIIEPHS